MLHAPKFALRRRLRVLVELGRSARDAVPKRQVPPGVGEVEQTFAGYRGLVRGIRGERDIGERDELRGPRLERLRGSGWR